jgi:hypothetical protein
MEREWGMFKAQAAQAQREQQREAYANDLRQIAANVMNVFNPPPPPEPEIIYIEKEEDPRWGQLPTLPTWR